MHILINLHEYTLDEYGCQISPSDILACSSGGNVNVNENSRAHYGMPQQYGCKGGFFENCSLIGVIVFGYYSNH